MKVSFDYDGTLTRDEVKEFAIELLKKGISIDIHSRRSQEDRYPTQHDDILHFGGSLIKYATNRAEVNVHLCGMNKVEMILESGALFHLDNERWECDMIDSKRTEDLPYAIHYFPGNEWKNKCVQLINTHQYLFL